MAMHDTLADMKILTIDDDQWIRNSLTYYFKKKALSFVALESAEEALELLTGEAFDIVICDYKLPGMDGLAFFRQLKNRYPHVQTVLITAYGTDEVVAEATALGITEFIQKPFTTKTIEECFARILARQRTSPATKLCS